MPLNQKLIDFHKENFGIEYAEIVDMDILTPGPVNWWKADAEMINELAASYDPLTLRAPIVADHITEGPAFGHVLELSTRDGGTDKDELTLVATVGLTETGAQMVKSGEWNERSVQIWDFHPMEGVWYLLHLSLLGASNPACPCLSPVTFPARSDIDEMPEAMARAAKATAERLHTWGKSENHLTYRIRPLSRFKADSFEILPLDEKKGISMNSGQLLPKYKPEGASDDAPVTQAVLFELKSWDLAKAKSWVNKAEMSLSSQVDQASGEVKEKLQATKENNDEPPPEQAEVHKEKGGLTSMPEPTQDPNSPPVETPEQRTSVAGTLAIGEENISLQQQLDAKDREVRQAQSQLKSELAKKSIELKATLVQTKLSELQAAGYLVPAQLQLGLLEALVAIPDDAMVGDAWAGDVVLSALKHGGKLLLTDEIKVSEPEDHSGSSSPDLDKLEGSGVKVAGLDVAKRVRELMDANKDMSHREALAKASAELG